MIEVNNLIKFLKKNRIEFFTGVPDSILKNFSLKIENYSSKKNILLLQMKEVLLRLELVTIFQKKNCL